MVRYLINYLMKHSLELAKFVFVGLLTAAVYFSCFHLLYGVLLYNYKVALTIAYVVTVVFYFVIHRMFTFKANNQELTLNVVKYLCILILNYSLTLIIVWFFVDIIDFSPYIGLLMSTAINATTNFLVLRHFVFQSKSR